MDTNHNTWHWQELGSAWKGVGIYHVTLTVPSREPLLGTLVIPENDPKQAWVERTELGEKLLDELVHLHIYFPETRILQFCLMPDHLHAIIYVTRPLQTTFNNVVRGFWQGANKLCRENPSLISPEFNSGLTDEGLYGKRIFTERPFVRPLSRRGQLKTMIHYVQMNPQRLATKRLMPELFWVQDNINIAGRIYRGVGCADLLQRARYMPVHVRGTIVENAEQNGDDKPLRDYMNSCVLAARKGAVMVSPFISKYEQAVMAVLLKEGHPFIYIADNGFRDFYKPQDCLFDAVARKQVLILSPWDYDPKMTRVSRSRCVEMNAMAEEICKNVI
jgi:REP element-mobilizing transposase RayT